MTEKYKCVGKKINVIREIILKKASQDIRGVGIPKGTRLFVIQELPKAPFGDHHRLLKVRVDNGTGYVDMCPETVVRDTEIVEETAVVSSFQGRK